MVYISVIIKQILQITFLHDVNLLWAAFHVLHQHLSFWLVGTPSWLLYRIQIRTIQLLIFNEKFAPLTGFEPGTSQVPNLYDTNWAILGWIFFYRSLTQGFNFYQKIIYSESISLNFFFETKEFFFKLSMKRFKIWNN